MVQDRRVAFIRKWLARGRQEEDLFDRFLARWIALVIAAQRLRDHYGDSVGGDTDRLRVIDYFSANRDLVLGVLAGHEREMKELAGRHGQVYGNPIVDASRDLRPLFRSLAQHYTSNVPMASDELVRAVAELLNKIRNNVFTVSAILPDGTILETVCRPQENWSAFAVWQGGEWRIQPGFRVNSTERLVPHSPQNNLGLTTRS